MAEFFFQGHGSYRLTTDKGTVMTFYASGDTSVTDFMTDKIPAYHLDYAVLPIDGIYNMNPEEATKCAEILCSKYVMPVHMKPGQLFNRLCAEQFTPANRLIVEAGSSIKL